MQTGFARIKGNYNCSFVDLKKNMNIEYNCYQVGVVITPDDQHGLRTSSGLRGTESNPTAHKRADVWRIL